MQQTQYHNIYKHKKILQGRRAALTNTSTCPFVGLFYILELGNEITFWQILIFWVFVSLLALISDVCRTVLR